MSNPNSMLLNDQLLFFIFEIQTFLTNDFKTNNITSLTYVHLTPT